MDTESRIFIAIIMTGLIILGIIGYKSLEDKIEPCTCEEELSRLREVCVVMKVDQVDMVQNQVDILGICQALSDRIKLLERSDDHGLGKGGRNERWD